MAEHNEIIKMSFRKAYSGGGKSFPEKEPHWIYVESETIFQRFLQLNRVKARILLIIRVSPTRETHLTSHIARNFHD
jgi:hypothetical protein